MLNLLSCLAVLINSRVDDVGCGNVVKTKSDNSGFEWLDISESIDKTAKLFENTYNLLLKNENSSLRIFERGFVSSTGNKTIINVKMILNYNINALVQHLILQYHEYGYKLTVSERWGCHMLQVLS